MTVPTLLQCIAEAVAEKGVRGLAEMVPGGPYALDVALSTHKKYRERKTLGQLRDDVQKLAETGIADVRDAAIAATRAALPGRPADDPEVVLLTAYLTTVPDAVRASFRSPADPSGMVVPATFNATGADAFLRLLPGRPPLYRPGDPLPGGPGWVLEELLGMGGFGEVWRATLGGTGQRAAVKFCHGLDPEELAHELRLVDRALVGGHPAVVPMKLYNLEVSKPWVMFEYVAGGSLTDEVLRWRTLPPAERAGRATAVLAELADAVGRLHRLDPPLVHRDLKPANILWDAAAGRWRITDFGMGGVTARAALAAEDRNTISRTALAPVRLRGAHSPLYAGPQQKRGDPPDPRDDVHALGVVGYQMLTGQLGEGPGTDAPADLAEAGADPVVAEAIVRCLAGKADRRPADAAELAAALRVAPPRPEPRVVPVAATAAQVAPSELPPLPPELLAVEGRVLALEAAVAGIADGTHPDLADAARRYRSAGEPFAALAGRVTAAVVREPTRSATALRADERAVPDEVLFPLVEAARRRVQLLADLGTARGELLNRQRDDFTGLLGRVLKSGAAAEFPVGVWARVAPLLAERRYRFAATPAALLHEAEEYHRRAWDEEQAWRELRQAGGDYKQYMQYLEQYSAGRHAVKAKHELISTLRHILSRSPRRDRAARRRYLEIRTKDAIQADRWHSAIKLPVIFFLCSLSPIFGMYIAWLAGQVTTPTASQIIGIFVGCSLPSISCAIILSIDSDNHIGIVFKCFICASFFLVPIFLFWITFQPGSPPQRTGAVLFVAQLLTFIVLLIIRASEGNTMHTAKKLILILLFAIVMSWTLAIIAGFFAPWLFPVVLFGVAAGIPLVGRLNVMSAQAELGPLPWWEFFRSRESLRRKYLHVGYY